MAGYTRRGFLNRSGTLGVAGAIGLLASKNIPLAYATPAETRAEYIQGTTLDTVAAPQGSGGYRKLVGAPGAEHGYQLVVRTDLAQPRSGRRDDKRKSLACFVQISDIHIVDAECPARLEFTRTMHSFFSSAFRPHETMSTHAGVTLVNRVNSLGRGPFTGRHFDCVVSTGDNTDNKANNELEWLLKLFSGGQIYPSSGDPAKYEGVQSFGSQKYWIPDSSANDLYKRTFGFPQVPNLLSAVVKPFSSPALKAPWFSVFGNHDCATQGNIPGIPGIPFLDQLYTMGVKFDPPAGAQEAQEMATTLQHNPTAFAEQLSDSQHTHPTWWHNITPDRNRRPLSSREYIGKHFDSAYTGPGPVGHGFSAYAPHTGVAYYTFPIAGRITGICLDTTNHCGLSDGSIGRTQMSWLQNQLESNYGQLFIIFSHHTSKTMDNVLPDPRNLFEKRFRGADLVQLLKRHPRVIAWVNGHVHANEILPQNGGGTQGSFWEINTASHIDFPQQARIIEVADNGDGTLSMFTTLIEADSPYQTNYTDFSLTGFGSLYRELSFNDMYKSASAEGKAQDHNTELLLVNPLA